MCVAPVAVAAATKYLSASALVTSQLAHHPSSPRALAFPAIIYMHYLLISNYFFVMPPQSSSIFYDRNLFNVAFFNLGKYTHWLIAK